LSLWRAALAAAGLLLAFQAPLVVACGYCVEDKIAAVYDHAAVIRAMASRHQVAFFHIDGPLTPGDAGRRALAASVDSVARVDRGSARVSLDSAALAVSFDPRRASLGVLQRSIESKLRPQKLSLVLLRVMDRPAELKTSHP
jgi:hypothetical protein